MTSPVLSFQNLIYRYEKRQPEAVSGISFEIAPATVTAILGPNGAGKTTLLHLALGILKPVKGEVLLAGKPLSACSRREISQWIGLVPQKETTPFDYSVLEYVVLGRAPYLEAMELPAEKDWEIAQNALHLLDMDQLARRPIPSLSGGEMQLVMAARALAQEPRILLLDEPTAHLDLGNKTRILRTIRQLAETGVTVLFTTHDSEAASAAADNLVLMRAGKVLAKGTFNDIFTAPLLSETYGLPVRVQAVDGRKIVIAE